MAGQEAVRHQVGRKKSEKGGIFAQTQKGQALKDWKKSGGASTEEFPTPSKEERQPSLLKKKQEAGGISCQLALQCEREARAAPRDGGKDSKGGTARAQKTRTGKKRTDHKMDKRPKKKKTALPKLHHKEERKTETGEVSARQHSS